MKAYVNDAINLLRHVNGYIDDVLLERDLAISYLVNKNPESFSKTSTLIFSDESTYNTLEGGYFILIYHTDTFHAIYRMTGSLYHDFGCDETAISEDDLYTDADIPMSVMLRDFDALHIENESEEKINEQRT